MLTDKEILASKGKERAYRLADDNGLYLEVSPAGGKLWRFRYRFGGKEKLLALGQYPEVRGPEARIRAAQARQLLADDRDPSAEKQAERERKRMGSENSFEALARQWHAKVAAPGAPLHLGSFCEASSHHWFVQPFRASPAKDCGLMDNSPTANRAACRG